MKSSIIIYTINFPEIENINVMIKEVIEEEGLQYIAGYVAKKFRFKYPNLGCQTKDLPASKNNNIDWVNWIMTISDGYLIYPSNSLLEVARIVNSEFDLFHQGPGLSRQPFIIKNLTEIVKKKVLEKNIDMPDEIIKCLVSTRTYIRLRNIQNKIIYEELAKKRRNKTSTVTESCKEQKNDEKKYYYYIEPAH